MNKLIPALLCTAPALGQTVIAPNHKHAWSENTGWINLGDGAPVNGTSYANATAADFGVNMDASGMLSGLAWGENIGWINFTSGAMASPARPARLDLTAQRFRGFAWSENVGWLNLDDATHFIAPICKPDCEEDGDLDVFDFLCFQGRFSSLDPYADFEGDGDHDIFDFLSFQNAYALGCP